MKLSDGGEFCLDWISDEGASINSPICLYLPGITGHSRDDYIKSLVNTAINKLGARCVVFNNRGQGGCLLKTPRTSCVSNTEDLTVAIEYIKTKFPDSPLMAIGISYGGIILGNYLADRNAQAKKYLIGAMLISASFNPYKCNESIEKPGINAMLSSYITKRLIKSVKKQEQIFKASNCWNLEHVYKSQFIREFDERFTCPMFGMSSYEEYCTQGQIQGKIHKIQVPTLALNAEDDIFSPQETKSLPLDEAKASDAFAFVTTTYGGHNGFLEGIIPSRYDFSTRLFEQFGKAIFNSSMELHSS